MTTAGRRTPDPGAIRPRPSIPRAALLLLVISACSSVEVVRLQTGPPAHLGAGSRPTVSVQARCLGFYVATVGLPSCTLDRALNELLLETSRKLGAERVLELRFEATPEHGWWWITKLLWFRSARASALVVIPPPTPPPLPVSRPAQSQPTAPASQPTAPTSQPTSAPSTPPGGPAGDR